LSGSATIAALLAQAGGAWVTAFAALTAIAGAFDLVVGTARAARLHADLAREFFALEKAMVKIDSPDKSDLQRIWAQRLELEATEPPVLRVLDSICHNELLRAMGYAPDDDAMLVIAWYQRVLAHFLDVRDYKIVTLGEKRVRAAKLQTSPGGSR